MGWERIRAWFQSLKPVSDEEILSWEFRAFSEEPEARPGRSRREIVGPALSEGPGFTSASTPGRSSGRDVLDVVRKELHEEPKPILEISYLSHTVPTDDGPVLSEVEGPVEVLQGFSLRVQRGEFVSVLDPTGDSKSLLLNLVGGLSRPTRGTVYLDGQEVWQLPDWKRSRLRR